MSTSHMGAPFSGASDPGDTGHRRRAGGRSVILAGLVPVLPAVRVSGHLARLLTDCLAALRTQYVSPGRVAVLR